MNILLYLLSSFLLPCLQCFYTLWYLTAVFGQKPGKLRSLSRKILICSGFFLVSKTIYALTDFPFCTVLIFLGTMLLFSVFFLEGDIKKRIFVSLLIASMIIMNYILAVSLVDKTLEINLLSPYHHEEYGVFAVMFVSLMFSVLEFQILLNLFGRSVTTLRTKEWLLLVGVLSLSAIVIFLTQRAFTLPISKDTRLSGIGADAAILIMDFITIRLIVSITRHHNAMLENKRLKMQMQYQAQHAEMIQQQEKALRRLRHDFRGTLSVMHSFLEQNQISELREYISKYENAISDIVLSVHTNQPFVDAVLNTKLTYAKSCGITCICHISEQLPDFPGTDYCTLLGNLLDNAIEALIGLKDAELQVDMHLENDILQILVRNKVKESVCLKNPNLLSSKKDSVSHGFGISSVKRIAKQYNGSADFYDEGNWFVARVEMDSRCLQLI